MKRSPVTARPRQGNHGLSVVLVGLATGGFCGFVATIFLGFVLSIATIAATAGNGNELVVDSPERAD